MGMTTNTGTTEGSTTGASSTTSGPNRLLRNFLPLIIDVALRYTKGNQLHAALLLGISRTTLRAKLRSLGFSVEKQLLAYGDCGERT